MSHQRCHSPEGHVCQKPSGRQCYEKGCPEAAGTNWGPYWCPTHDEERLDRITRNLKEMRRRRTSMDETEQSATPPKPLWDELADGFFNDPDECADPNTKSERGRVRGAEVTRCVCGGIDLGDDNWDLDVRPDCPVHGDLAPVEWPTFRRDDEEDPFMAEPFECEYGCMPMDHGENGSPGGSRSTTKGSRSMTPADPEDALDWLRKVCAARTILEKAGDHDLAEWVWGNLRPEGVPLRVRYDALVMAGYPFRNRTPRPGSESAKETAK